MLNARTKYSNITGIRSKQLSLFCLAEQEQETWADLYEAYDQSIRYLERLVKIDPPLDKVVITAIAGDARAQANRLLPLLRQLLIHLEKGYV